MKDIVTPAPYFLLVVYLCVFGLNNTVAQIRDSIPEEAIAVMARPSPGEIRLRWAPLSFAAWRLGNNSGYRIERYVITRKGVLISRPVKEILVESLKPLPESQWEPMVRGNAYAAIAAQALFGDRFEVDLEKSDVISIVNKAQENEQRFAFALFSADMSPDVARSSALLFSDTRVNSDEKYLYRIFINGPDSLRGSIFIGPDDQYKLMPPQNPKAEFTDKLVSLKWDHSRTTPYTAYKLERSQDGSRFREVSSTPLVTVAPDMNDTHYEYATDTLPDASSTYYYRIRGITPFGEEGPPSEVVSGRSIPTIADIPYITSAVSIDNRSILLEWAFDHAGNSTIEGFDMQRAMEPGGNFTSLTQQLLPVNSRRFEDTSPNQVNYYRVRARGSDKKWYHSHIYFAQLIDSIPPAVPSGLTAEISDGGAVLLSWHVNIEKDIYGYRVYRSNHRREESAQLTVGPVSANTFHDSVNLQTLNEKVYYKVMAVDINQNHSGLSDALEVLLPDKVRPQPPVFLPVKCLPKGILLTWHPSGSDDVAMYQVYRKELTQNWQNITTINSNSDSIISFFDSDIPSRNLLSYTVIAIDDAGLRSEPALPVSGIAIEFPHPPAVIWRRSTMSSENDQLTIAWKYDAAGVAAFRLFRATEKEGPQILQTLPGSQREYVDSIIPGNKYKYRIMAVFEDGQKSSLSDELEFDY